MKDEFVTYNQALALKELGFNEPCLVYWVFDGKEITFSTSHNKSGWSMIGFKNSQMNKKAGLCIAPLKQQVFRWFRDEHQLFYTIETNCSQLSFEWGFDYTIYDKENDKWLSTEPQNCPAGETTYKTYEEAESACINKLIEIVKNK